MSAIHVTYRREGARELLRRSVRWLAGERRFHTVTRTPPNLPLPSAFYAPIAVAPASTNTTSLSYVIVLTGFPAQVEHDAYHLLQMLNAWHKDHPDVEVIVVTDGVIWKHIARVCNPQIRVLHHAEACYLPNRLFQLGLLACSSEWITFALPGVDIAQWLNNGQDLLRYRRDQSCVGVAGHPAPTDLTSANSLSSHRLHWLADCTPDSRYPAPNYPAAWLEMLDMLPLHNCLLNRDALLTAGGFAGPAVLQTDFWWETCIRLSRVGQFAPAPVAAPTSKWRLDTFPLPVLGLLSSDTTARLVLRYTGVTDAHTSVSADLPELANVAPFDTIAQSVPAPSAQIAIDTIKGSWPANPLRITLLSSATELHQTHLFFANFFHLLEGCGILSWRVIDDEYATTADVAQADLLILCRVRSDNGRNLLDCARRFGKPVLVMLDDHWFKMSDELPAYREILGADSPLLQNVLHCLRHATAVVTFSPVLRNYLSEYAAHVFELPLNIDLSLFNANRTKIPKTRLLIGYAGSPRQDQAAFDALVDVAQRHTEVVIYYLGANPPSVLRQLAPEQLCLLPETFSVRDYVRALSVLAPDIGLAPLGSTNTERAKTPAKYLDYAAVYCAGIYSRVEPYAAHVTDRETGLFTNGASTEAWVAAIEILIADSSLRTHIQTQAYRDVQQRFSTEAVLPAFLRILSNVLTLRNTA